MSDSRAKQMAQMVEFTEACASFQRVPGSGGTYRSDRFPGFKIQGNPVASGWFVYRDGVQGPVQTAYTFDLAVAVVSVAVKEAAAGLHTYHVAYSAKQGSFYVSDETGECVSSLYDTKDEAHQALIRGEF